MQKDNICCILIEATKEHLKKIKEAELEIYGIGIYKEDNEISKEV